MLELCSGQLKLYSSVKETAVDWLWYPYIPFGKITLLQGDPGGGKSTLMMSIIAAVSSGNVSFSKKPSRQPMHVIYQCSEDDVADTIKPRLEKAGADCKNVAFLDEEGETLTLTDERIRIAIADFNAKLLVIDPFQAYLGETDMANILGIRKALRQLGVWAAFYKCAIVLVGHLNKRQGTKDIYRSLGSIDLVAAARSVIQIQKYEDTDTRVLTHIKSSLAPNGKDLFFDLDSVSGIRWIEPDNITDTIINRQVSAPEIPNKKEYAADMLQSILSDGPVKATDVLMRFKESDISEKTLMLTKKIIGIESFRKGRSWYWKMPDNKGKTEEPGI